MDKNYKQSISLSFIAIFFFFVALYLLKGIVMPIIISLFLVTLIWPVNKFLNDRMPKQLGDLLSFILLIAILVALFSSFYFSVSDLTVKSPEYKDSLLQFYDDFRIYLRENGIPSPAAIDDETVKLIARAIIGEIYITIGYIAFITALLVIGIPEILTWRSKLRSLFGEANGSKVIKALNESAFAFQKYLWITTLIGLFSASLTGLFTWYMGLDFPLTWAFLAFILNYIPIIGTFLMIIPPTVLAFIQFSDMDIFITVFIGMTIIQFFIGNIIDPKFQGKYLSMSSVVILISIAFWGYLWGIMGAFLAVPITNSIMITFFHFTSTKWLANIISEAEE